MGQSSASTNGNPYTAPADTGAMGIAKEADVPSTRGAQEQRRFRRRCIPAALSWFASTLLGIAAIFGFWQAFAVAPYGYNGQYFSVTNSCMASALFAAFILNSAGGRKWMIGQWGKALLMNVTSIGVVVGVGAGLTVLEYVRRQ